MSHGFSHVLAGAALLAALVYWGRFGRRDDPGLTGSAIRAASVGLFAAILWTAAALGQGLWTIALGLSLGALGDWFLARRSKRAFLAGTAAFALGLYARTSVLGFDGASGVEWVALAFLLGLIALTEVWLAPRAGSLR